MSIFVVKSLTSFLTFNFWQHSNTTPLFFQLVPLLGKKRYALLFWCEWEAQTKQGPATYRDMIAPTSNHNKNQRQLSVLILSDHFQTCWALLLPESLIIWVRSIFIPSWCIYGLISFNIWTKVWVRWWTILLLQLGCNILIFATEITQWWDEMRY